jgi:hypothetical protein
MARRTSSNVNREHSQATSQRVRGDSAVEGAVTRGVDVLRAA